MTTLNFTSPEQARQHARDAACVQCGKRGTHTAHEVRKEGVNQGRLFMKCGHCGHFTWLSEATRTDPELDRIQVGSKPCPRCGKGRYAKRVGKEGPNKGRVFLVCGDDACGSFEWVTPVAGPPVKLPPRPSATEAGRTEQGLLADIRDNPRDDGLRLIYADWLEENGRPERAELIRVQLRLARMADDDPERAALERRKLEIFAAHEAEWVAAIDHLVVGYYFAGGLLDEVIVEAANFVRHADELLHAAPAAEWVVRAADWQTVKDLVRCDRLLKVRRLALAGGRVGATGARILAESPNVANLKELDVAKQGLGHYGVQALAGSAYLRNLEALGLRENDLSRSAVPHLAGSPNLPRLRRLGLAANGLRDEDVRSLVASPYLKELRELDLSENRITSEGAESLARSRLLGRLRSLDLSNTDVGTRGAYLLRQSPHARADLELRY